MPPEGRNSSDPKGRKMLQAPPEMEYLVGWMDGGIATERVGGGDGGRGERTAASEPPRRGVG